MSTHTVSVQHYAGNSTSYYVEMIDGDEPERVYQIECATLKEANLLASAIAMAIQVVASDEVNFTPNNG